MTTNQLTYLQLQEAERANRANEAIKQEQTNIEREYKSEQADLLNAQTDEILKKLPYEVEISKLQREKLMNEAQKILTEDLAKRVEMGDMSAISEVMKRTEGTGESLQQSWNSMSAGEKIGAVASAIRTAWTASGLGKAFGNVKVTSGTSETVTKSGQIVPLESFGVTW